MNDHDRSRQHYYGEEARQDYYPRSSYSAQREPQYSDATSHLHQQNVNVTRYSHAPGNANAQQYSDGHMHNYNAGRDAAFNGGNRPMYYQHPQNARNNGTDQRFERRQENQEGDRYRELYEEVFAPRSRTPISGTRTSTERTTPIQTSSSSRSMSRYGSSTTSSSDYEGENWEENIVSALNGMAGNLKRIGGIHCNQDGPDSTEVQLKLNLPLPVQYMENMDIRDGFSNAMATLSPKKCGNMPYRYSNLDNHVVDAEEKFLGTMDQIQENVVPIYKSLFSNQSDESSSEDDHHDEVDEDKSESTYENPQLLSNRDPNIDPNMQYETTDVVLRSRSPLNVDGIPSQIIVSHQPSGLSSADSWKLSSRVDKAQRHQNKPTTNDIIATINNNLDVAIQSSRRLSTSEKERKQQNEDFAPNNKQDLRLREENEAIESEKKAKLKTQDFESKYEIPEVVDLKRVSESYSDLTVGVQMTGRSRVEEDYKPSSAIPAIKTEFSSGDEIMGRSKASFQRNSNKSGKGEVFVRSDPPEMNPSSSRSHARNKAMDTPETLDKGRTIDTAKVENGPLDYLDDANRKERQKLHEEQEKAKKMEEERQRQEAEAKAAEARAAEKALEAKRLEEQVEAEIRAAREAIRMQRAEEQRKRLEAEAKAVEDTIEAKRLEKEKEQREAEAKAFEEAKKAKEMKEKRKRIEAEAKVAQEALDATKLEVEQKQREAEKIVGEEARKAKEFEEERKRIEAETKLAREALDALYAEKMQEEKRQREIKTKKIQEENRHRKAEAIALEGKRLRDIRKRVEEESVGEKSSKYEETKKIGMQTKSVETRLKKDRRSKKEENRIKPAEKRGVTGHNKERASMYKVRGFDDYCKSVTSNQSGLDEGRSIASPTNRSVSSDEDFNFEEEESTSDVYGFDAESKESQESNPSNEDGERSAGSSIRYDDDASTSDDAADSRSSDQASQIFTDATTSFEKDSSSRKPTGSTSDGHSSSTTERLRNTIDVHPESVELKYHSERTRSSFLTKPRKTLASDDVLLPNASTLSTMPTFDQGTVYSGQQSLGRFVKSSDERSVASAAASYSHRSARSARPVAVAVTALPREREEEEEKSSETESDESRRSSILGRIVSFLLSLALRALFTVILFLFTWIKHHLTTTMGTKRQAKVDCTPSKFALQPDQSIRREEIQDRSTDSLVHRSTTAQRDQQLYLGYEDPHREHYSTTMIIKPPSYSPPGDGDEVGTCVESIVPDAHRTHDGKVLTWNITRKGTETSSLTSPPSRSFGVLKSAYSALSAGKCERSNWIDRPTIDDEMSYYE